MAAMRLPRIAKVGKVAIKPELTPPMPQKLEKPLLETVGDDPGMAPGGVVAGSEDRKTAAGQTVGQVDANGLLVRITQLEPAFRLDQHSGHPAKWNHGADRHD